MITPIYIENLGPVATDGKILNLQKKELDNVLNNLLTTLKQLNNYAKTIASNSAQIKKFINDQKTYLTTILSEFNQIDTTVLQPWLKYVRIRFLFY